MVDVLDLLRAKRREIRRNAAVLDHISSPPPAHHAEKVEFNSINPDTAPPSTDLKTEQQPHNHVAADADSPLPISKNVLTALFAALDAVPTNKQHVADNYIFIDNDDENNFLYALVMPLVARLLAVSCPGVVCLVQLPRPDSFPDWASPASHDCYGSSASRESKSVSNTTPSPRGTSRTPSPSDEGAFGASRKSLSPDHNERTAQLIRHADKVLSGAEAAAEKRATEAPRVGARASPLPGFMVQNHRSLRLMCNGFEVLTGKMPSPRRNMGAFSLASVSWEKAGVVSPEHPNKGVMMNFSNGMMTPTEGVVVTFSNGSLCYLTLRDPLSILESLKPSNSTGVVVFSFSHVGHPNVGTLLSQNEKLLNSQASEVLARCKKSNVFIVEVGQSAAEGQGVGGTRFRRGKGYVKQQLSESLSGSASVVSAHAHSDGNTKSHRHASPQCSPMRIGEIPRAIPLFVNTINQTFIDAPYRDRPETPHEDEIGRELSRDNTGKTELRKARLFLKSEHQEEEKVLKVPVAVSEQYSRPEENGAQTEVSSGLLTTRTGSTYHSTPLMVPRSGDSLQPGARMEPLKTHMSGSHAEASIARPENHASVPGPAPFNSHLSAYSYYGFGHGHTYPRSSEAIHASQHQVMQLGQHNMPPAFPPGAHGEAMRYLHPLHVDSPPVVPHGQFPHHHNSPYPNAQYYSGSPSTMMHRPIHNGGQPPTSMGFQRHDQQQVPPPHFMDARRDMPVQFSSHHAVNVEGGRGDVPHDHRPRVGTHGPGWQVANPQKQLEILRGSDGRDVCPALETPRRGAAGPDASQAKFPVDAETLDGNTRRPIPSGRNPGPRVNSGNVKDGETSQTDKENALRALMQMRQGVGDDKRKTWNHAHSQRQKGTNGADSAALVSLGKVQTPPAPVAQGDKPLEEHNQGHEVDRRVPDSTEERCMRKGVRRARRGPQTSSSINVNSHDGLLEEATEVPRNYDDPQSSCQPPEKRRRN